MSSKITLFTFLLLLLTLPFALAEMDVVTYSTTSSFNVFGGAAQYDLCQCGNSVESFVITNTGSYSSKYQIANTLTDYVRLSDGVFELQPGESKTVYIYLQAPCDDEFSKDFIVEITDVFGNKQVLESVLSVETCQNLQALLLANEESPIDPCTPITYSLEIVNTGVFTETYDVELGGVEFEDFMSTPYQSILIPAGETGLVQSTLNLSCDKYGAFTIPFSVEARQTELVAEFEHLLEVNQAYDFEISLTEEDLCALDQTSLTLTVANNGEIDNSYTVDITSPTYISADNLTVLEIESGDEKSLELSAQPGRDDIGHAPLTVTVTSQFGDIVQVIEQNLSILSCHQIRVALDAAEDISGCAEYKEVPLTITNEGLQNEFITLESTGAYSWVLHPELELSPGESFESTLIIDVPEDVSIEQEIVITGTLDSGVTASDSIGMSVLSNYECARVNINKDPTIKYGELIAPVELRHDGVEEREYTVNLYGDEWLSLEETTLTLAPGEVKTVEVKTYQVESNTTKKAYFANVEVLSDDGMLYTLPLKVKLTNKNIFAQGYDYYLASTCKFFSWVFLVAIIVLAVIMFSREGHYVHRGALLIALLVVWLVVSGIAFANYGLPEPLYEPLPEFEDPLDFAVFENEIFTLDASDYFVDPDNNTLSFELDDEIDNVSVVVDGSVFTFTPDKDFVGARRFRITADDGDEDERSPRMYLHVIDKPEYSLNDVYTKYCVTVNVLLLLIAAILLYFVLVQKKAKEENEFSQKPVAKKKAVKKKTAKKKTAKKATKKRRTVKRKKK